ncbi:hypothetical protein Vadar_008021 [Vaccinium darrowii]|uniref:Uncharacterized protein n=1 Tax=Vaccinium darrowii TaxID=229202 RepID=A0ACB7ZA74_9ERIC|nr:hypothetical protein Vadar_008021 [Vaccinium darrowii]
MKRLRSSEELDSFGDKGVFKDWGRRDEDSSLSRSSSHRSFHYKSENGRKGLSSSSSRYDRVDDDREVSRPIRKRSDYDSESYDRRMNYDRYRDGSERGILSSSPRSGYGSDRIHRSESFSSTRREFPKGFRSERDRSRRADSVSSWKRFGLGKDVDEGTRTGTDSVRGSKVLSSENKGDLRSPRGPREAKSPTWSKDSGSEQSKSVEVKKGEDLPAGGGSGSEMEEGELEPEPDPAQEKEPAAEEKCAVEKYPSQKLLESKDQHDDRTMEDGATPVSEVKLDKDNARERKQVVGSRKAVKDLVKQVDQSSNGPSNLAEGTHCNYDVTETSSLNGGSKKEESPRENNSGEVERNKDTFGQDSMHIEEKHKEDKGIDGEVKAGDIVFPESTKESSEGSRIPETESTVLPDGISQNFKDKGKSVAVSPSNGSEEEGEKFERDDDLEGPSTRGLELFFRDPVKQPEKSDVSGLHKPKDEKLVLEPLDLSLSLPNVLLPINSHNIVQAPGSPSHARSAQSIPSTFLSDSDGFTASMSFSGSQLLTHNPSCSLTHNSFDNYEQSVGSKPLFQGMEWNVQPPNEQNDKEVPMHSRVVPNGNGFYHQSQASQSLSNGQGMQGQLRAAEGSSTMPIGFDHQLGLHRQLSGVRSRHHIDGKTPSNSVGSHENGSEYSRDKRRAMRERDSGTFYRGSNQNVKEKILVGGAEFVEPIITMIVSEPVPLMAKKCSEMTGQVIACLKDSVRDIILNAGKRWQLSAFQKALQNRSDITLDMLLKAHRVQLEILVALRTGLQEFLPRDDISISDLAEIFLNLRCRNLTCRNILPVDECDCKVCMKKNGFCSSCMCLVCSKFDMASNTCSWVGCDVCLHWCHADCALRESYIRNGRSASGPHGSTEMQFHCVACDHPSEMFGFVKEVFQSFAKEWTVETLSKELEYMRRIFSTSEDMRGKRLHNLAVLMLSRLANKSDLREVQHQIMGFLTESDSLKSGGNTPVLSGKEVSKKNQEGSNGIAGSSQEAIWFKQLYSEKAPKLERASSLLPTFSSDQENKHTSDSDSRRSVPKGPVFDELESIVRIKHAEAGMFQTRADDARREAEGLKRIAIAKNEKIEDEYTSRIAKLRLSEAEEMRKQKVEELQVLERAHREYYSMKTRMEADIKDLLSKMEATKRNLSM